MVWDLTKFDFGVAEGVEEPGVEPDPRDYIAYTVYHIARALEYHNFKTNATIEPILQAFSPRLEIVRAIQPIQRFRHGKLENLGPREITKPSQAAAVLLYALLPGKETERCSACTSLAGNGPFALCISGGERWTSGACLCCYHTGNANKCDLQRQHANYLYRQMREMGKLTVTFPHGAEKQARADELSVWLGMIVQEQTRRSVKVAMAMAQDT